MLRRPPLLGTVNEEKNLTMVTASDAARQVLASHTLRGPLGDDLVLCSCGCAAPNLTMHQMEEMFEAGRRRGLHDAADAMNEQHPMSDADRLFEAGYEKAIEVVHDVIDGFGEVAEAPTEVPACSH